MRPRVRVLCLPDVDRAIGGVKQLYRHVEHLVHLGWDACVVTQNNDFRPSWFESTAPASSITYCALQGDFKGDDTILLLPETYLGVNLSDFWGFDLSHLPRVIFNQNAYYSFGSFRENITHQVSHFYDHSSVLQVLSISEDTHEFLNLNLGIRDSNLSRIVNAVEPIFRNNDSSSNIIHWMPRKNSSEVSAILSSIQRAGLEGSHGWRGEPLQDLSHHEVAEKLNNARIFLSFGHPEGFGLPLAEAMASGCWVIGYSGGGGRELFRYGASEEVAFGDWPSYMRALQRALIMFRDQPRETTTRLKRQSLAIKTLYSRQQELESISCAWETIHKHFIDWSGKSFSS